MCSRMQHDMGLLSVHFASIRELTFFICIKESGVYWPNYSRGTQREYSLKPLKHSIVERTLEFKR